MKTYVLTVSRYFPATHKRKSEPTCFVEKILSKQIPCGLISKSEVERLYPFSMFVFNTDSPKIHTIRSNYELWAKRIKEVQDGKAILSIRYWSGKPYNSPQVEFCLLDKDSGCGVQKLEFDGLEDYNRIIKTTDLCENDGLSPEDFKEWFRKADLSKPMAIIHFTKFRY